MVMFMYAFGSWKPAHAPLEPIDFEGNGDNLMLPQ